jgi:PiT family inorganic phosphate transporter
MRATRALPPRAAVLMAAAFNFLGILVMTLLNATVAMTIKNMLISMGIPTTR